MRERRLPELWRGIWVIVRREIVDTLRDWRIVAPITLLVLAFPFIAEFAAMEGLKFVNKYGAALIMERLFPFLMLVVGFFPSTFSLVIALETFVGEKERRSLEPLLATPLTDTQLYIGKLIAATLPPLIASYVGMIFYMLLLGLAIGWWPSFSLMVVAFALSTTQALVMVTVAVIISAQSTSVRAANLLASFIIIPMSFVLQAEASLLLFADFTALWLIALFLFVAALLFMRIGLRMFDREHLLGRELDTLNVGAFGRAFVEAIKVHSLRDLYRRELPVLLRRMRRELAFTLILALGGSLLLAGWGTWKLPLPASALQLPAAPLTVEEIAREAVRSRIIPAFSPWAIFLHNARSLLIVVLLSAFSLGIAAQLMVMLPISLLSYLALQAPRFGLNPLLLGLALVVPHGIFELPAIFLVAAQAMRLGMALLTPAHEGGGFVALGRELGYFVKLFVILIVPLLMVAAVIETTITPRLAVWVINTYLLR